MVDYLLKFRMVPDLVSLVKSGQKVLSDEVPLKNQQNTNKPSQRYPMDIDWLGLSVITVSHIGAFIGVYLLFDGISWQTMLYTFLLEQVSEIGMGIGVHRLYSHRTFTATLPVRIVLAMCHIVGLQNSMYEWVLNHRLHHKFNDTDADPHNSKRGMFFAHMGWLLLQRHQDIVEKGKSIDMSDVEADPVVRFDRKHYTILATVHVLVLSIWVPWYFWNEYLHVAFFVTFLLRYVVTLHKTWMLNSFAHFLGTRPVDKNISATNNLLVKFVSSGEAWHNYHHVFPWDYKSPELGPYSINLSTNIIDFMAKMGWAYDLKTVSEEQLRKRMEKTGDLSFLNHPSPEY